MRIVFLVIVLVSLVQLPLCSAASAQQALTWAYGKDIRSACKSEGEFDQGICVGFAVAIAGIAANQPYFGWRACIPAGVSRIQLRHTLVNFLDRNMERLELAGEGLAAEAFARAFPCSQ